MWVAALLLFQLGQIQLGLQHSLHLAFFLVKLGNLWKGVLWQEEVWCLKLDFAPVVKLSFLNSYGG